MKAISSKKLSNESYVKLEHFRLEMNIIHK